MKGIESLARPVSVGRIDPTMNPTDENVGDASDARALTYKKYSMTSVPDAECARGSDNWHFVVISIC